MTASQYSVFYNDFGKFRRLPVEGLLVKNESEGANENLPFFVCLNITLILLLMTVSHSAAFADSSIVSVSELIEVNETVSSLCLSTTTDTIGTNLSKSNSDLLNASGIFNACLGAFVGFFLSTSLQDWLRRRHRKKCIVNIALELKDIKNTIQKCKDAITPVLSYAIYTPIWEAVVGNGDILELKEEPYYDDLFLAYGHISKLSKMEDFAQENGQVDMTKIWQQRICIIKLLSTQVDFPDDKNFEEHKLYSLLEKYTKRHT